MKKSGHGRFNLAEIFTRKARTLFSLAHSGFLVWQDGVNFRSMPHHERLRYLEFRPFLNFKKGVVVYDIGANVGEMACFFAVFPTVAAVYCFEPVKNVYEKLVQRTEKARRIQCFPVALGDNIGRQRMNVNDFDESSSMLPMEAIHVQEFPESGRIHEEEVPVMTLEDAVREYRLASPDFIKIDVQGFEDRVIRGGEEIVKMARYCMLELSLVGLYRGSLLMTDVNALMRDLGFRLVSILGKVIGKSGEILQVDGLYQNNSPSIAAPRYNAANGFRSEGSEAAQRYYP
jgi:FkbM family methyltransferase